MLSCGDIRQGYCEYLCPHCQETRKVGFTCKSRLCLCCFKTAVDGWLQTARQVLFEGVVHWQVVLTVPKDIRPLTCLSADRFQMVRSYGIYAARYPTGFMRWWRTCWRGCNQWHSKYVTGWGGAARPVGKRRCL